MTKVLKIYNRTGEILSDIQDNNYIYKKMDELTEKEIFFSLKYLYENYEETMKIDDFLDKNEFFDENNNKKNLIKNDAHSSIYNELFNDFTNFIEKNLEVIKRKIEIIIQEIEKE